MLKLLIGGTELYDEKDSKFLIQHAIEVRLEHSLVSVSKWESKYQTPFLAEGKKTHDQILDYVLMMIISPEDTSNLIERFEDKHLDAINDYISSPQSATTFWEHSNRPGKKETITSELIYYWMVANDIPFECQLWHLNRLFALIRICGLKNSNQSKMSPQERAKYNRELNEKRKRELNTSG